MRPLTRAWAAFLVLGLVRVALAEETIESVEKRIVDQQAKLQSLQCTSKFMEERHVADHVMRMTVDYRYAFVRKPEGKSVGRIEVHMRTDSTPTPPGPQEYGDASQTTVFDGQNTYELQQSGRSAQAFKTKGGECPSIFNAKAEFQTLHQECTARLLPESRINGRDAHTLEFKPRSAEESNLPFRMVRYYDKESGIPLKYVGYDKSGNLVQSQVFEDLKIDADIPASRFVLKVPDGIEIVEKPSANAAVSPLAE